MGIEIERKFLLAGDGWRNAAQRSVPMAQGYLNDLAMVDSGAMQVSVRVRIEGDAAFLNMKSREAGPSRQEFDYPVPLADARALLALCVGGRIDKTRHYVEHRGHLWEIDEFAGANAGLIVAEVELSHLDEPFEQPDWAGEDVSHDIRYYNSQLARHPYATWSCASG